MKILTRVLFSLFVVITINACQNDDDNSNEPQLNCTNQNSTFSTLYNDIIDNENLNSYDTVDSRLHAYSFRVSSEKQLCSIGYQSFHEDADIPYDISIRESISGTVIYTESLLFSQNSMSYVTLDQNVTLQPNTDYIISRVQNNVIGGLNNVIGEVIDGYNQLGEVNFLPYTENELTILNAIFTNSSGGDVAVFNFLPKIDIIFAE